MKFYLAVFFSIFSFISMASHIVAGEISYRHLGGDDYEVTVVVLKDANTGAALDGTINITVYESVVDTLFALYNAPLVTDTVPATLGDPCVIPPSGFTILRGTYIDTIQLPFNLNGYYLTYQRCCWSSAIDNIDSPVDHGLTITVDVPGTALVTTQNSAGALQNIPPLVLCTDKEFIWDMSIANVDADSIVYSMCTPADRPSSAGSVNPAIADPQPYPLLPWAAGFSATEPFGTNVVVDLDPTTGEITFTPTDIGYFVVAVCATEYRNGVQICTKTITVMFNIKACDKIIPFTLGNINDGILAGNDGGGNNLEELKYISEDCGEQIYTFHRDLDTTEIGFEILLTGTATNGTDYPFIQDSLVMPIGVKDTTIVISGLADNLVEDAETIFLQIRYFDVCTGEYDSTIAPIVILDYQPLNIQIPEDSVNYCPDLGEKVILKTTLTGGIPPYFYDWYSESTDNLPNTPMLPINNYYISDTFNTFKISVIDQCLKTDTSNIALVYNQCPIIVPNVITLNGDYINDVFVIQNLENYDGVRLKIFNRWGHMIYQNDDYKNNWLVEHEDGTPLKEGVYFYFAEVINSTKYEYDDNKKTIYQAQGFFHAIGQP